MIKNYLFIAFLFFFNSAYSQNLVTPQKGETKSSKNTQAQKSAQEETEDYCIPDFFYPASAAGIKLDQISLAGETITWDVNPVVYNEDGYANYTSSESVDLVAGNSYDLSFHTNWQDPHYINIRAWIDYNQDNQFEDEEEIGYIVNGINANGDGTFNFAIPENTALGIYRLRAILQFPNSVPTNLTSCGTINSYGVAIDYNVQVINGESYCDVSVDYDVEPITSVSFGDFNNQTSAVVNATPAYEDFTTISTDVEKGETYNLAVKGNTVGQFEHDIRVFIDWNKDKVFDMDTEYYTVSLLPSTGTDEVIASIDITIPTDAALGSTRMRIIKDQYNIYEEGEFDACLNAYYGQVEDYTINVMGEIAGNPVTAINITTVNNVNPTIETEAGTLHLIAIATPEVANQEVNWSITSGSTFATINSDGLVTAIQNGTITVKASSIENSSIFDTIEIEITNQPAVFPAPYCNIDIEDSDPDYIEPITHVSFSDILNESLETVGGTPVLENFTDVVGNVFTNTSYTLTVKGNTNGNFETNYIRVYIDWNQNDIFDANEGIAVGTLYGSNGTDSEEASVSITIPSDAVLGTTRMRIVKDYEEDNIDACNDLYFGQAEDYTLNIQENLGTGDFTKNNLKIYPNPTTDFVTVSSDSDIKSIQVFNQLGQLIMTQKDSKINLSDASTGIYMVHVTLEDDTTYTQKIIKK